MLTLKRIELSSTNTIDATVPYDAQYLVKVYGRWRAGAFDRQWYGLNFANGRAPRDRPDQRLTYLGTIL